MSTNEQPRTATGRAADPSPAPEEQVRPGLREDLEAVWAISASDGPGAGVDAVLAFAGAALQRAAMEDETKIAADDAADVAQFVSEIVGMTEPAARRVLFRHAARRLALLGGDPSASRAAPHRRFVMLAPLSAAAGWLRRGTAGAPAGAAGR
ncbi:MAG: hypothetical protein ACTHKS_14585, partial [Gaiellaceae bacterium]